VDKDIRVYDKSELKDIFSKLNTVCCLLKNIEFDSKDNIAIKCNPQYLDEAIKITKKVRDMF